MLSKRYSHYKLECGTDEAGRGCLAGPVVAAAVISPITPEVEIVNSPLNKLFEELNDSKKLSDKKRFELRTIIEEYFNPTAVSFIHNIEIDEINILNASMKAMQECIIQLHPTPEYIIVDGNRPLNGKLGKKQTYGKIFTEEEIKLLKSIPNTSIIKGDSKYISIAAASILAKTYRDDYMNQIHEEFPMYHWNKNKGYPTKDHREAIKKYGPCKYHRMSFRLLPEQLELEF